jgi:hypothetical protein
MLNRSNNQTNRHQISTSTSKTVSFIINNTGITMEIIERKIGLATEGLQRYVRNWLRMKTSPKRKCSNYIRLCFITKNGN